MAVLPVKKTRTKKSITVKKVKAVSHRNKPVMPTSTLIPELIPAGSIIQEATRLSQSCIWQMMQDYYQSLSIEAWEKVPFFITSSANIADAYSDWIIAYLEDNEAELIADEPVTIVELAAGSGRFGFLALTLLTEKLLAHPTLALSQVRYVMTDFADANVIYWEQHDSFQPFIASALLDFAVLNPLTDSTLTLRQSQAVISSTVNPVIVIANYIFDTLPHDLFQIKAHNLQEGKVQLTRKSDSDAALPVTMSQVSPAYSYESTGADYYPQNPLWNDILAHYSQSYFNASVLVPVGALTALEQFKRLSNGRLLLLSSDKGYDNMESQLGHFQHEYSLHADAFSMMVNYDAVRRWFTLQGGQTFSSSEHHGDLKTVVASLSRGDSQPPQLRRHVQQAVNHHLTRCNSILTAYHLNAVLIGAQRKPDDTVGNQRLLMAILSSLRSNLCDPFIISQLCGPLYPLLVDMNDNQRKDIMIILNRSWQLYYPFSGEPSLPMFLGILLVGLGLADKALVFLNKALLLYPPNEYVYYWMGQAHELKLDYRAARDCYATSLEYKPGFDLAQERLSAINIVLNERLTDADLLNVG